MRSHTKHWSCCKLFCIKTNQTVDKVKNGQYIYIYIYMKSVTFLWGRACKQIWLHFSRGGAWKQIWVLLNYAKNYLLNFFREESRHAIANKSSCCVIRDFVTPCSKILCYFRERESADEPMGHQTNKKKIGFCFNWV